MKHRVTNTVSVCLLLTSLGSASAADAEGIQFFENKIRPVLSEHCYQCHSAKAAAAQSLKGGLLLDTRAGVLAGGESGAAIVPGQPNESLLISALRHESFEMPPKSKLPAEVIKHFVKWIELGAPDPRDGEAKPVETTGIDIEAGKAFWSFQPLQDAIPTDVAKGDWVKTDVDRFILARLEQAGIEPNKAASRITLIRRVYFDLWGLPPERADVEAFAADESPDAYERLVDKLLEGQHYGERWGRHWLDLARFAESNGYAFDKDRPAAYHYRDFVIKALNEDMPYDEFVRLQLAGDLLAPQDYMAQAATGFLAAGPFTSQQTQKERERSRYEQLDDIVSTMGTSMLGLTLGCARCHDHKFDPVAIHDYYRLTASFAETGFDNFNWDPDPDGTKRALDAFNAEHQPLVDARTAYERDTLPRQFEAWEASKRDAPPAEKLGNWYHIGPFAGSDFNKAFNEKFAPEKAVDVTKPVGELAWTEKPEWKDAVVHNTLTGDNSANYLFRVIEAPENMPVEVSFGCDDGIKVFLNKKEVLAKPTMGAVAADQHLLTLNLAAGRNELLVKIVNGGGPSGFYFSSKGAQTPKEILDILALAADQRNDGQQQKLLKWFAPRDPGWAELDQAEKEHLAKKPQPKLVPIFAARRNGTTYNFGADTRKVYFLARGNSNAKTGLATPAFLRVLTNTEHGEELWLQENPAAESSGSRHPRIALADWITDVEHGAGNLLARVIANRLWQHHFGVGLVATPSDFGSQGARPTHPELLDYLAQQLIAGGWKLKPLHRLIMTGAVYRQSREASEAGLQHDPDNKLWWRRPPLRMEAEIIRDNLLTVAGTFDKTMFGPGSLDQTSTRRSVYLTVKRSSLIPILQLFDAPDSIQSIGERGVTTVPPQALAMMNSPWVRQIAEKLATRVRADAATPPEIVESTFWATLSRGPSDAERERMTAFLTAQAESYGNDAKAMNLAVADYCQLMLCLNEFVYVD